MNRKSNHANKVVQQTMYIFPPHLAQNYKSRILIACHEGFNLSLSVGISQEPIAV